MYIYINIPTQPKWSVLLPKSTTFQKLLINKSESYPTMDGIGIFQEN